MTSRRRRTIAAFIAVAAWSLATVHAGQRSSAPAQLPSAHKSKPAPLVERVRQYWERRKAKDLPGAYLSYCAAYKARVSRDQFLQLTRLTRFDLTGVEVTADPAARGRSEVTVTYKYLLPTLDARPLEGKTTEMWAQDKNGQWCKEDEPLVLPFPSDSARPRSNPEQESVTERH
jgi:hypothetical protein